MKKTTEQFAEQLKQKHNLILTSEYLGAHEKINFLCKNNHENVGTATNVLQRGYKCKQCITGRKVISKIRWTEDMLAELQDMLDSAATTKEIAAKFETTESAVHNATASFSLIRSKTVQTLAKLQKVLAAQQRELVGEFNGANTLVQLRCKNSHIVTQLAGNVLYQNIQCPECTKGQQSSKPEKELLDFIKQHYSGWIIENDRQICSGRELDIVLPDLGLCFEFNGTYWHSDKHVTKHYHVEKTNLVEAVGFQLIHVHEHLWNTKNALVKEKILQLIKPQTRLGARQCVYKPVLWSEAKEFLELYHIQGSGSPTGNNHGLYYRGELVAIATFAKPRFAKQHDLELIRFCTKIHIQGALTKLLKRVEYQSLITYALRDWSVGKLYKATGFQYLGTTEPNYCYYKNTQRLTRYQAQKHRLEQLLENFNEKLSEYENMQNHGWLRVWDSGNLVFSHCRQK